MQNPFFRLLFVLIGISLLSSPLTSGQTASIKWSLTSNNRVTEIVGNIQGSAQKLSYSAIDPNLTLVVKDYSAAGTNSGQRIWPLSTSWPGESGENPSRYIQFVITAPTRILLNILSIQVELGGGGTGNLRYNAYYSTDDSFITRVQLNSSSTVPSGSFLSAAYSLNVNRTGSQSLYFRIYPWYNYSAAGSAKYFYLRNVAVSGTATPTNEPIVPTVTTSSNIINLSQTAVRGGGEVTYDGGADVIERGLCWNTAGQPTITDSKSQSGSGTGAFVADLHNLTTGSAYYVRAYATNAVGTGYGQELMFVASPASTRTLAFPGAEGWGKYTAGGRAGTVYEVTNLNDSGTGSLREAVTASGPRTVVFRVSGTIILNSILKITNPYITIAGQTAPGDGICIRRYPIYINADHVIIRYLRCRLGDESGGESDALFSRWHKNIIIDHCSFSWSQDETLSVYWCDSTTVQWCLVSESLYNSNHPKGAHGYGGIWGGPRATYHHNLLAHHTSRNPRFASGCGVTDFRNNVIFNWGFNSSYGGEKHEPSLSVSEASQINMVANYYKPGPATKSGVFQYRIANPGTRDGLADYGRWFIDKNVMHFNDEVSADNWTLGVQGPTPSEKDSIRSLIPLVCLPIVQQTADDAYRDVLKKAGADLPKRDSVDIRILRDVANGSAAFEGPTYRSDMGFGSNWPITGIIDSQNDVGGWPTLTTSNIPIDSDHDGMPDDWESTHALNPNDPLDGRLITSSGYSNLELYLNGNNFGGISSINTASVRPVETQLFPNYPNPFNPSTTIQFSTSKTDRVLAVVYSILGQQIATLANEEMPAGMHQLMWNAGNFPSGTYILKLQVGNSSFMKKLLLIK